MYFNTCIANKRVHCSYFQGNFFLYYPINYVLVNLPEVFVGGWFSDTCPSLFYLNLNLSGIKSTGALVWWARAA